MPKVSGVLLNASFARHGRAMLGGPMLERTLRHAEVRKVHMPRSSPSPSEAYVWKRFGMPKGMGRFRHEGRIDGCQSLFNTQSSSTCQSLCASP